MRRSALALAAALLIAGCGSSTGTRPPEATPAAPTTPTPAIASTPAATSATSPPAGGPLTTVAPGTYEVGTGNGQIAPGKYFSPAPFDGSTCYYARLRNNNGEADDIIGDELSHGQIVMTVRASDAYVTVSGCTFLAAS